MGVFEIDHRASAPRPCSLVDHGCVTHPVTRPVTSFPAA